VTTVFTISRTAAALFNNVFQAAIVLMAAGVVSVGPVVAQEAPVRFEVVSIKPSAPDCRMMFGPELRNGRLRATCVTLRKVLAVSYGLAEIRIVGPDWLDKERFDLLAKSPTGVPDREIKVMLQAAMSERLHLAVHHELKEMSLYDLVVAKGGVKMALYPSPERNAPGSDALIGFPAIRGTVTMGQLAEAMTGLVQRQVIDKTGLTGRYNMTLSFAPETAAERISESGPPDVFTAVQEQLGLRLVSRKDKIAVVVVDHIERMPTDN
jgi:uncharacterized protein (TIGR03435 family)